MLSATVFPVRIILSREGNNRNRFSISNENRVVQIYSKGNLVLITFELLKLSSHQIQI